MPALVEERVTHGRRQQVLGGAGGEHTPRRSCQAFRRPAWKGLDRLGTR